MADIPPLTFSHIGISAHDLEAQADWYKRMLGLFETDRGTLPADDGTPIPLIFLSRSPDEHHQVALVGGRPQTLGFNPINQMSFRVENVEQLKRYWHILTEAGVADIRPVTHGNALSIYFRDPEGNRVEAYLDTPWYVTQPMRVPIDLSQSVEQIMAAAEAHARSLPGFRPLSEWRAEMAAKMGVA